VDRCGLARIVAQHAEDALARAAGPADRRAHVEGVKRGEFVEMALDEIGELEQDLLALIGLEPAPGPFEGLAGRRYRAVDVLGLALGDRRQQFTGCRIAALEALS
jgi:hypothetical protein